MEYYCKVVMIPQKEKPMLFVERGDRGYINTYRISLPVGISTEAIPEVIEKLFMAFKQAKKWIEMYEDGKN